MNDTAGSGNSQFSFYHDKCHKIDQTLQDIVTDTGRKSNYTICLTTIKAIMQLNSILH
jgi:hypothetical protein